VRVALREDRDGESRWSVPVALDDDAAGRGGRCQPCAATQPVDLAGVVRVTVSQRVAAGRDDDGDQMWEWVNTADVAATFQIMDRTESSDATGQSVVTAFATIAWPSDTAPPGETAEIVDSAGVRWPIIESQPLPDAVWLRLERVDDAP
jgi:hypothetical protein